MIEIAMTLYNRVAYTKQGIQSLHKAINNEIKVNFIDDCSAIYNTEAMKEIIRDCGMTNFSYYVNEKNLGIERNIFFVPYVIDSPYTYITDNDVIYSSKFLEQLKNGVRAIGAWGRPVAITFFDTPAHKIIEEYPEDYNVKATLGGASLLIKTDVFQKALSHAVRNGFCDSRKTSWDYGLCDYFNKNNGLLLSTKKSYVEHIGEEGVHSRVGLAGSFVQARNFEE